MFYYEEMRVSQLDFTVLSVNLQKLCLALKSSFCCAAGVHAASPATPFQHQGYFFKYHFAVLLNEMLRSFKGGILKVVSVLLLVQRQDRVLALKTKALESGPWLSKSLSFSLLCPRPLTLCPPSGYLEINYSPLSTRQAQLVYFRGVRRREIGGFQRSLNCRKSHDY